MALPERKQALFSSQKFSGAVWRDFYRDENVSGELCWLNAKDLSSLLFLVAIGIARPRGGSGFENAYHTWQAFCLTMGWPALQPQDL